MAGRGTRRGASVFAVLAERSEDFAPGSNTSLLTPPQDISMSRSPQPSPPPRGVRGLAFGSLDHATLSDRASLNPRLSRDRWPWAVSVRDYGKGRVEVSWGLRPSYRPGAGAIPEADDSALEGEGEVSSVLENLRALRCRLSAERRARAEIRRKLMAIRADHMVTLTVRANLEDRSVVLDLFRRWTRAVRAHTEEFAYVAVPEQQARGAWHVHVGVVGRQDLCLIRGCWLWALGVPGLTISNCVHAERHRTRLGLSLLDHYGCPSPGNVDVSGWRPRGRAVRDSVVGIASYLAKYLGKGLPSESPGLRRYWPSKGIVVPCVRVYVSGAGFRAPESPIEFLKALDVPVGTLYTGTCHGWAASWSLGRSRSSSHGDSS